MAEEKTTVLSQEKRQIVSDFIVQSIGYYHPLIVSSAKGANPPSIQAPFNIPRSVASKIHIIRDRNGCYMCRIYINASWDNYMNNIFQLFLLECCQHIGEAVHSSAPEKKYYLHLLEIAKSTVPTIDYGEMILADVLVVLSP